MKSRAFFSLLIVAVIASSGFTYVFYNAFLIENIVVMDIKLKVGDRFGLNVDPESINFGRIMPGNAGLRNVTLENNASYPLKVSISKYGEIADWIDVSENNFILEEKEKMDVTFYAYAPNDAAFGNYTSKTKVIFKRVLFG